MRVEKYDWRSKIKEAMHTVAEPSGGKSHEDNEPFKKIEKKYDWRFREAIANAIAVVRSEQEAQREREAFEKAKRERACQKAMLTRDVVILPLLNRMCEDFAADGEKALLSWRVHTAENADTFSAAAVTLALGDDSLPGFSINAEASVDELAEFVTFSVVCAPIDAEASSAAPLIEKAAKFPTTQKFDELVSRTWFHKQLAASVRMCVLATRRRLSGEREAAVLP